MHQDVVGQQIVVEQGDARRRRSERIDDLMQPASNRRRLESNGATRFLEHMRLSCQGG